MKILSYLKEFERFLKIEEPYETKSEEDALYLIAALSSLSLVNRFISPSYFEKDKLKVSTVVLIVYSSIQEPMFRIKVRGNYKVYFVGIEELLSLVTVGKTEDEEMTKTLYMVK